MFFRAYRRSRLRRYTRTTILISLIYSFFDLLSLLNKYQIFQQNLVSATVDGYNDFPPSLRNQKIFICAQFWTAAPVLAAHWNDDLLDLIEALRVKNVYVSIYESGSLDQTKELLNALDKRLARMGVRKHVVLDPTSHAESIERMPLDNRDGWIHTPRSGEQYELRRIPYLASLRNKALKPLYDGTAGMDFDRILFLNDVDFRPADVLTLLATRNGDYSVACALDFKEPPRYYDTFVMRDMEGRRTATEVFPYFRGGESRRSMLSGQPARVQSCWNGMLAMDPAPFISKEIATDVLKFRGISDSLAEKHLEGSECCLIHADLAAMDADGAGIWVNPASRVGYSIKAYDSVHDESGMGWMTQKEFIINIYRNRIARWLSSDWSIVRRVRSRVSSWVHEGKKIGELRVEPGEMCLEDEMQVLIWNGWAHV